MFSKKNYMMDDNQQTDYTAGFMSLREFFLFYDTDLARSAKTLLLRKIRCSDWEICTQHSNIRKNKFLSRYCTILLY